MQQNANSDIDTYVPILKQYKMMKVIIDIYKFAKKLIEKGIPISEIKKTEFFSEYPKLKNNITNIEMGKFDELEDNFIKKLKDIEEEYNSVLS